MLRFWPVLFLVIPIIEVYLLIEVGGIIGAGWTILLIVLTLTVFAGPMVLLYLLGVGISWIVARRSAAPVER